MLRRPRTTGFTLLEVLLVIVVVGLLMAIAIPDWTAAQAAQRLDESVERFETLVAMCRASAINDGRGYRIVFRPDGSIRVMRQRDAFEFPDEYVLHESTWARRPVLLEDVWVSSVLPLPDGLPPEYMEDEDIGYEILDEEEYELIPIEDLDEAVQLDFAPNGQTDSFWWVLRATSGRGVQLVLDGRLGRVDAFEVEYLPDEFIEPPEPLEPDPDLYYYDPNVVNEE